MKGLRHIALIALFLFSPFFSANAQEKEDVLMVWSTTTVTKSLGEEKKWTAGVMSEYRHQFHEGVSSINQYLVRPSIAYKALPWLSLKYQMDFAATYSGFHMRFLPEVAMTHKAGDFTLSYRQRVQTTWKVKAGTNSTVLRSRAKIDYRIPETPLGVHFAIEPYWCDFSKNSFAWFQKIRWYAGFDVKLTDNLTFTPEYLCQTYHNHQGRYARRTYDDHIIYLTLTVKL